MTYTRQGDEVTVQMTVDQYKSLLTMLGVALAAADPKQGIRWRWVKFVNEMNRTNPEFTPYEIPAEYR